MFVCYINVNIIIIIYIYSIYYAFENYNDTVVIFKGLEGENRVSHFKLTILILLIPLFLNVILIYLCRAKNDLMIVLHNITDLKRYNNYLLRYIKRLKEFKYPTHIKNIILEKYIEEDCPICLLILDENSSITNCGHVFHQECLKSALDVSSKCPYCREII